MNELNQEIDEQLDQLVEDHNTETPEEEVVEEEQQDEETTEETDDSDDDEDSELSDEGEDTDGDGELHRDEAEPAPEEDVNDGLDQTVEERLQALRQPVTPELELRQAEAELAHAESQLSNEAIIASLPMDTTSDGKQIAGLTEEELNEYMVELQDSGNVAGAYKAQSIWSKAQDIANEAFAKRAALAQQRQELVAKKLNVVANQTEQKFLDKVPELKPHMDTIAYVLKQQIQQKPALAQTFADDPAQLERAVLQVIEQHNLLQKETKNIVKKQTKKPSAPDQQTASKRVQTKSNKSATFTEAQIENMSQAEFNRREKEIMKAMAEGRVI